MPSSPYLLVITLVLLSGCGCTAGQSSGTTNAGDHYWVVRTDFSDDMQWKKVCRLISAPQKSGSDTFYAYVRHVNDQRYRDMQVHDLVLALPDDYPGKILFVVDSQYLLHPEFPVLVIGFNQGSEVNRRLPREALSKDILSFRTLPSQIQAIENNLSISNMDFDEFSSHVDKNGVFRGFPQ